MTAADVCECCGHPRTYSDSNYWYYRKPYWFWRLASSIACALRGCRINCVQGDCYRCG